MLKITCQLELVTPAFWAGADRSQTEIRTQSIKGLLRFWWRAIQPNDITLSELAQREGAVFGAGGDKARISSFHLNALNEGHDTTKDNLPRVMLPRAKGREISINILEYLAYGTYEWEQGGNRFIRSRIKEGTKLELEFLFRKSSTSNHDEVLKALEAWVSFGGVGSRSRNGFGSLAFVGPVKVNGVERQAVLSKNLFKDWQQGDSWPQYTAFSKSAMLFETKLDFNSWSECLGELGKTYRKCRMDLEPRNIFRAREFLGAPLIEGKVQRSRFARRAKPYFLHVTKEQGRFRGQILFLPSIFHPKDLDVSTPLAVYKDFNACLERTGTLRRVGV
ncbi:MAG: cytoplasmic protein [Bacillota bacterium]|nr:MAG: cytoplasmic protein [Bacillota bacterium]